MNIILDNEHMKITYFFKNLLFYTNVVSQYGMWDQIRVDHGTEFYLALHMQNKFQEYRGNTTRSPYIQTTSKQL